MNRRFSELGIKPSLNHFTGEKLKINKVLNKEITVIDYNVKPSNFKGDCLQLQIAVGDKKHVLFTGSTVLIETIKMVDKTHFPFETIIIEENDHYEFT